VLKKLFLDSGIQATIDEPGECKNGYDYRDKSCHEVTCKP
jgi:hypothetical protein